MSTLKQKVMRRIYGIWFVRRGAPMLAVAGFFLFLALRETARSFFVAKIVENFIISAQNISNIPSFILSAIAHAPASALVMVMFSTVISLVLGWRFIRSLKGVLLPFSE
jgi:hypothetical protein